MDNSAHTGVSGICIRNFKSVREVALNDCRRINVLIGRPNVGKSNILEALALFDSPYITGSRSKSLKSLVRVENISELFHNGLTAEPICVTTDVCTLNGTRTSNNGLAITINDGSDAATYAFGPTLNLSTKKEPAVYPRIMSYFFPGNFPAESSGLDFLLPPSGANLMETVANLPALKSEISGLFHRYGLKMMFDVATRQIKAMKENGNDMFLVPFSSMADSLQRLIFYKAAIHSNHNKTLCFEEPEAHTFPPYISGVVNDILSSTDNQFFITTHSPYVLSALLEDAGDSLAVYAVDMTDSATVVKRLTDDDMQAAYDCGMDMFFNLEALL